MVYSLLIAMCIKASGSQTTTNKGISVSDESSGVHFFELHLPTASGIGGMILLLLGLVLLGVYMKYRCCRKKPNSRHEAPTAPTAPTPPTTVTTNQPACISYQPCVNPHVAIDFPREWMLRRMYNEGYGSRQGLTFNNERFSEIQPDAPPPPPPSPRRSRSAAPTYGSRNRPNLEPYEPRRVFPPASTR